MRRISDISLKRRLFIVTIALSIVSILTGGIAFLEMSSINGAAQNIYQNGTLPISFLATARSNFLTAQGDVTLLAVTTSPSAQATLNAEINTSIREMLGAIERSGTIGLWRHLSISSAYPLTYDCCEFPCVTLDIHDDLDCLCA